MQHSVEKIFKDFEDKTILIVGDVMIDAYMWGDVERISPEAPVPVISVSKKENRMGGAANVGLNVRALGAKPIMCAIVGDDHYGSVFKQLLKKREMSSEGILLSENRMTTVKTRIISNSQHLLRIDEEVSTPLDKKEETEFIYHLEKIFNNFSFDAIIFEDYDKGNITPAVINTVVEKAKTKNIPVLVDPKKRNFKYYKGVTVFKPNFKEICEGTKTDIPKGDFEALSKASGILQKELSAKHIFVTLSELGVFVSKEGNSYFHMPAQLRDITDVSGAGDTVISVTACVLATGADIEMAVTIANIAGGIVCEKVGVVPINKDTLLKETLMHYKSSKEL